MMTYGDLSFRDRQVADDVIVQVYEKYVDTYLTFPQSPHSLTFDKAQPPKREAWSLPAFLCFVNTKCTLN